MAIAVSLNLREALDCDFLILETGARSIRGEAHTHFSISLLCAITFETCLSDENDNDPQLHFVFKGNDSELGCTTSNASSHLDCDIQ